MNRREATRAIALTASGAVSYWGKVDFPHGVDEDYLPLKAITISTRDDVEEARQNKATKTLNFAELARAIDEYSQENIEFSEVADEKSFRFIEKFSHEWLGRDYDTAAGDADHAICDEIMQIALFGKLVFA